MIEFILKSQNFPFTVSLTIMLLIAFLEGVTTLLGMGLSSMIDSFLPDFDVDMDLDADADVDGPDVTDTGIITKTFGWFRIGQVPFLIILIAFLTVFGLSGLMIQITLFKMTGLTLPGLLASAAALPITLPIVRIVTGIIARVMPKDETEAVTEKSFIGRVATITLGTAKTGKPAQAKLKDEFGTSHYIMVEPDLDTDEFRQGDQVLLVRPSNNGFRVIKNDNPALIDSRWECVTMRPRLKIKPEPVDRVIEVIGLIATLILLILPVIYYPDLPDTVPRHFSITGKPDAFASRGIIWLLPVVGLTLYTGMTVLIRFPFLFNYPVTITSENAAGQYKMATRLIRLLKTVIACLFCYLTHATIRTSLGHAGGLGWMTMPAFIILILAITGIYIYRSFKYKPGKNA